MLKRLGLAVVFVSLPTVARAQGAAPSAAVCDGSEISRAERGYHVGRSLAIGTAAADVVAILTIPRTPDGARKAGSHFGFIAATSPIAIASLVVAMRATPGEPFWERVISRMKVGETKAADVRLCLHRPDASSSSTTEERWTYVTARPSGVFGDTYRTVRLTFRDSVLANVERTEVKHSADGRHGSGGIGGCGPASWVLRAADSGGGGCVPHPDRHECGSGGDGARAGGRGCGVEECAGTGGIRGVHGERQRAVRRDRRCS